LKPVIEEIARFVMTLLLIAGAFVGVPIAGELIQELVRPQGIVQTVPEPSKEEIRAAHKYHGVLWSWQDGEECYFKDEKGRVCKLFRYRSKK